MTASSVSVDVDQIRSFVAIGLSLGSLNFDRFGAMGTFDLHRAN